MSSLPLALVTGGSGYFGSLLVRRLLQQGWRVRVLDINEALDLPDSVEMVRGDIRNPSIVSKACEGVQVVHHNVAQVPLAKNKHLFDSVNIGGSHVLLDACVTHRVPKLVLVSSSAVFGAPDHNPVTEKTPPRPQEAYGHAKLRSERLAMRYADRGLDVTIVRPRTILGHGRLGIFQILFELVRQGRAVYLLGDGTNRYQFVHADDLADACISAGTVAGVDVFNIGAEQFGSMRDLLEALVSHAGTGSVVRSLPAYPTTLAMRAASASGLSPLGPYHALMYGREMFFDISHAKRVLGWQPVYGNEQMICESYDDYLLHRDEVLNRKGASHHRSPVKPGILKVLQVLP